MIGAPYQSPCNTKDLMALNILNLNEGKTKLIIFGSN